MANKGIPMTQPVSRSHVDAFYRAFASRDPAKIAAFLDDDVEWMIVGPIDLFEFCGPRRGKRAVLELFETIIPRVITVTRWTTDIILVDHDRAATFNRLTGLQCQTGRTISYRIAHFLRFRDDKLIEFRAVLDSFDAAEQMLGHPIDLSAETTMPELQPA
jgi:ketosteroid isomerase-like protein